MIGRIRGRQTFQRLAQSGRRVRTKSLWCSYLNQPEAVPLRVAFSVGRSIGPSTRRNRLRRRLRAIVATAAPAAGLTAGLLLVGVKPAAAERTFVELESEVAELLGQIVGTGH